MEAFSALLTDYIVLVVMLICAFVGYLIKTSISIIPNRYIPLIMAILGIVINCWVNNFVFTPQVLLGGLASGWAATGGFETIKNLLKSKS